ncbi:hypothetical protein FOA52_002027 [Chlamydomonas sp. UWO 241]|nr:hypothetical protein FOA52_002027 [Chlamydomonas sp. UWO 241]
MLRFPRLAHLRSLTLDGSSSDAPDGLIAAPLLWGRVGGGRIAVRMATLQRLSLSTWDMGSPLIRLITEGCPLLVSLSLTDAGLRPSCAIALEGEEDKFYVVQLSPLSELQHLDSLTLRDSAPPHSSDAHPTRTAHALRWAGLPTLTRLTHLNANWLWGGLSRALPLLPHLPHLASLHLLASESDLTPCGTGAGSPLSLSGPPLVADFKVLAKLPRLTRLSLRHSGGFAPTSLPGPVVAALADCTSLTELDVGDYMVSSSPCIAALAGLPRLTRLTAQTLAPTADRSHVRSGVAGVAAAALVLPAGGNACAWRDVRLYDLPGPESLLALSELLAQVTSLRYAVGIDWALDDSLSAAAAGHGLASALALVLPVMARMDADPRWGEGEVRLALGFLGGGGGGGGAVTATRACASALAGLSPLGHSLRELRLRGWRVDGELAGLAPGPYCFWRSS